MLDINNQYFNNTNKTNNINDNNDEIINKVPVNTYEFEQKPAIKPTNNTNNKLLNKSIDKRSSTPENVSIK